MIYHSPINTLPISLLLSKALLIAKMISESAFNIKSAFDSKSAFRYHFWMKKCKVGAFGKPHIFVCAKRVGSRSIDSYIFAHAAVAKRTFNFEIWECTAL